MTKRNSPAKIAKIPQEPSQLEALFWLQLLANGVRADWAQQVKAIPGRNFKFDFACEKLRILVELQGGNYQHGAHSRPMGLKRDYQKANLAQRHGWTIYQFDSDSVRDGEAIMFVMEEYER